MDHADAGGVGGEQEESYWQEEDRRTGGSVGQVLGEVWLQEFQKVYPDYRSSKKNLFRKYK